ncbi:MAG: hypothetical protein U5L02_07960 [Rheinheimera sp.]|nr:hypothetical protein [Rheinheimera sp.]
MTRYGAEQQRFCWWMRWRHEQAPYLLSHFAGVTGCTLARIELDQRYCV